MDLRHTGALEDARRLGEKTRGCTRRSSVRIIPTPSRPTSTTRSRCGC
ncbi:hypothetical protein NKH77_19360 [Streptomyces sp. M19]